MKFYVILEVYGDLERLIMTDTVNFSLKIKDEQLLTQPCVGAQRLASLVGYLDLSVVISGLITKSIPGQSLES